MCCARRGAKLTSRLAARSAEQPPRFRHSRATRGSPVLVQNRPHTLQFLIGPVDMSFSQIGVLL